MIFNNVFKDTFDTFALRQTVVVNILEMRVDMLPGVVLKVITDMDM